jgi:transcriptional regulator with XRE-family HTH domain
MSKLKFHREKLNLTQEELATKSGVSVRTIQRIESGIEPKGYTLKVLAKTLNVDHNELINTTDIQNSINYPLIKLINLSSLPVTFIPPLNIIFPLIVMFIKKEFNPTLKQIVSIQILWTILSFILFMVGSFVKNWFSLGSKFILIIMMLLVLTNIAIIILNAIAIDRDKELSVRLNFSFL